MIYLNSKGYSDKNGYKIYNFLIYIYLVMIYAI